MGGPPPKKSRIPGEIISAPGSVDPKLSMGSGFHRFQWWALNFAREGFSPEILVSDPCGGATPNLCPLRLPPRDPNGVGTPRGLN